MTILTILKILTFFYNFDNWRNFHNSDNCFCHFDNWKDNPGDLWHLIHWLQFWPLRTWIHDNLCYLTINCDTGQHSQFLRCLIIWPCLVWKRRKIWNSFLHFLYYQYFSPCVSQSPRHSWPYMVYVTFFASTWKTKGSSGDDTFPAWLLVEVGWGTWLHLTWLGGEQYSHPLSVSVLHHLHTSHIAQTQYFNMMTL